MNLILNLHTVKPPKHNSWEEYSMLSGLFSNLDWVFYLESLKKKKRKRNGKMKMEDSETEESESESEPETEIEEYTELIKRIKRIIPKNLKRKMDEMNGN